MTPQVIDKKELLLAGYSFFGDPFTASGAWTEENEIGKLWKRFMGFCTERASEIPPFAAPGVGYEVHIWGRDIIETGHYEVFAGMAIQKIVGIPVDLSIKVIPAMKYAVFTLAGKLIAQDLSAEMQGWLKTAGLRQTGSFIYNLYDERYKGTDDLQESEIEVYVPIE